MRCEQPVIRRIGQRELSGVQILWLGDDEAHDTARVGGKAANLSRLAAHHPVPPGFAVVGDGDDLGAALAGAYAELARRMGASEPEVAVRSSALDEDGLDASFAGMHETYLGIAGVDALVRAVDDARASAHAPRALEYRRAHGLAAPSEALPVLVQALVPADSAAVVFSANPVTGVRHEVVINASWGLGESIVGGTVTPDTYVLARPGLAVVDRRLAEKRRMTIRAAGGSREVDVPGALRRLPSISDEQAREAAELAVALEHSFGHPVDLELAWSSNALHLLQARPITTLALGEAA
jgi:phosphoenolpyruvate synthase/pyruvate phosphate dikinase